MTTVEKGVSNSKSGAVMHVASREAFTGRLVRQGDGAEGQGDYGKGSEAGFEGRHGDLLGGM